MLKLFNKDSKIRLDTLQNSHGRLGRSRNAKTAQKFNKAGYAATLVACGWAGAVLEKVTGHLGRGCMLKELKNAEKVKRGPTNQPTDGPTDRQSGV